MTLLKQFTTRFKDMAGKGLETLNLASFQEKGS
jgi:hypothetical protein